MQPITDPSALSEGATLYHSAFGFASVTAVESDAVVLDWERQGTHLPRKVRFDALRRVYAACATDGFFHRALHHTDVLNTMLASTPGDAVVLLLEELGGPQRLRDLMDWLVGRELFTPKSFVHWWGSAEALLKSDARLDWEGEWVQLTSQEEGASNERPPLESGTVDVSDAHIDAADATIPPDDLPEDPPTPSPVYSPSVPSSLADAELPAAAFVRVARAFAAALSAAHAEGRVVSPTTESSVLLPDGTFVLAQGEEETPSTHMPLATPEDDVRQAAVVLLEAFLGRRLPGGIDGALLLPYLRHCLPEIPPGGMMPLYTALHPDPALRPSAAVWAEQWDAVSAAEFQRNHARRSEVLPHVGYDSHVGRVKLMQTQTNQDALWLAMRGDRGLFVLCDGISVSDAGRGDIASKLATQAIGKLWELVPSDEAAPRRLLDRGFQLANRAICERSLKAANGDLRHRMPMGTTVTVAMTEGNRVHLSWLGDSPAFLVSPLGVARLSADDNVAGERLLAWFENRNRSWDSSGHALTRYLGHFDEHWQPSPFPAHHDSFVLLPGESLVLCSDGVTDYIGSHPIEVAMRLHATVCGVPPYEACQELVSMANRGGGGDNTSVIILNMPEPQPDDPTAW